MHTATKVLTHHIPQSSNHLPLVLQHPNHSHNPYKYTIFHSISRTIFVTPTNTLPSNLHPTIDPGPIYYNTYTYIDFYPISSKTIQTLPYIVATIPQELWLTQIQYLSNYDTYKTQKCGLPSYNTSKICQHAILYLLCQYIVPYLLHMYPILYMQLCTTWKWS